MHDSQFMRHALALALKGAGRVLPNPMVGCVIVKDDKIIAEGFHAYYGGPHAERSAVLSAVSDLENATWYITLEPCSHHGKTPPCVDLILQYKPARVVIAMRDPNPLVTKRDSIQLLRDSGVVVDVGCLEEEALFLNRVFLKMIQKKEPYLTLKVGQSLDGKIALSSGESKYITNDLSRRRVHELRRQVQGIVIGAGTVLADNPMLDIRFELLGDQDAHPDIIIFDSTGKVTPDLKVFHGPRRRVVIMVDPTRCASSFKERFPDHVTVWEVSGDTEAVRFKKGMEQCFQHGYVHLLLEGGSRLYSSALKSKCVDECYFFIAPVFMGEANAYPVFEWDSISSMAELPRLTHVSHVSHGSDVEIHGLL